MGKYNRASTTRKLQKLTAELPTAKEGVENLSKAIQAEAPKHTVIVNVPMKKQLKEVAKSVAEASVKKVTYNGVENETSTPNGEGKQDPGHTGKAGNPEVMKPTPTTTPVPVQPISTPNVPESEPELGKTADEIGKMNVYQKLTLARRIVANMQLKKSGANDEAGFNYFELADFVPMLNKLGERIGIMPQFSMTNELATLKIVNTDKPKEVAEFSIPTADLVMADAEGKVAEGIQVLGGKTTYLRRYLYQIAFEISVKDTVDSRGKTPPKPIDELDQADIDKINATGDIDSLAQVCKDIKARKGFSKNVALLKHYTAKKEALGL